VAAAPGSIGLAITRCAAAGRDRSDNAARQEERDGDEETPSANSQASGMAPVR